jgi:subtilisin family serine protease
VAPNSTFRAYKVCAADASCPDFAIEAGIAAAIEDEAQVINMSFAGPGVSESLNAALQAAWNAGIVLVAGAGNTNATDEMYPAAFPNVVAVGAFDEDHLRATFSTHGNWVDISAPGNVIISAWPMAGCAGAVVVPGDSGCYNYVSGTSMASPHVAGAAAMVLARPDVTTNQQAVDVLLQSADPDGVGAVPLNSWTIHGGLNLHDALSIPVPTGATPTPTAAAATPTATSPAATATLTATPTSTAVPPTVTNTPVAPTATPLPPTATSPAGDTITVQSAQYNGRKDQLKVEATSSMNGAVTLTVYNHATNVELGTMSYNSKKARHALTVSNLTAKPAQIRIESSGGGEVVASVSGN